MEFMDDMGGMDMGMEVLAAGGTMSSPAACLAEAEAAAVRATASEDEGDLRRGPWTEEEDMLLVDYIAKHGEGRWNSLARCAGLRRTGKSCRLRWLNYLRPDVRRGNITPEEHMLIVQLQARWGNRWSKIARYLPGRTDNEIKNFWRTKIQKRHRTDSSSAGTSTSESTELATPAAEYRSTAAVPAVAEDQGSSNSGRITTGVDVTPDYDALAAAARQQSSFVVRSLDHQLELGCYAVHGGGGGAVDDDGVPPEFLQAAAAASGDNFWALEDFWPTVPSLHGDC